MNITTMLQKHGNQGAERVATYVTRQPEHLGVLLGDMASPVKRVKNAAAKAMRVLSETDPQLLAPHWPAFTAMLKSDDTIVKWIAIDVCGNLARVDAVASVEARTMRELTTLLADTSMVTATHAVDTLGKIAEGQAKHRSRITTALETVGETPRAADCRNILVGRAIQAYGRYWSKVGGTQKARIRRFVEGHTRNPLPATGKKAERLLRQMQ